MPWPLEAKITWGMNPAWAYEGMGGRGGEWRVFARVWVRCCPHAEGSRGCLVVENYSDCGAKYKDL